MDLTFDDQIDQLHRQLEAKERDARMAEQRLQRLNLPVGSLKPRGYGELPQVAGLTARAMVARQDPALAMLLGLPVPRPSYEEEETAAIRQLQADRMRLETEQARAANAEAARRREWEALNGRSALTGRRFGQ